MKKINIIILSVFLVVTVISCDCAQDTSKATNNIAATFVNGDLMTNVSADPVETRWYIPVVKPQSPVRLRYGHQDLSPLGTTIPTNVLHISFRAS